jgi:hypothetical protein
MLTNIIGGFIGMMMSSPWRIVKPSGVGALPFCTPICVPGTHAFPV